MPLRPSSERSREAVKSGTGAATLVESWGSWPEMALRRRAARDAAVSGLEADAATEGGGLADGPAGVGAEGGVGFAGGDYGGGPSAGAAGDAGEVPRIGGDANAGVFRGGAHGELVHVGAAKGDGASGAKAGDGGGIVGGDIAVEDFGGAGAGLVLDVEDVLDGDGDAAEGEGDVGL
jgi:hypothetical protein